MLKKDTGARDDQVHWLGIIERNLERNPDVVSLSYDRAVVLRSIGENDNAEEAYHSLLMLAPAHFSGLFELSSLLILQGRFAEALPLRRKLLLKYPRDATAIAGYAELSLLCGNIPAAKAAYAEALMLAPHHTLVHDGLARICRLEGHDEEAAAHEQAASDRLALYPRQYRGDGVPIPLLLFVSEYENCESTYADRIIDENVFLVTKCIVERLSTSVPLPEFDIGFNGITDADRAGVALTQLSRLLASSTTPVLNAPAAVGHTTRIAMARRLANIEGVLAPKIIALSAEAARDSAAATWLEEQGFRYPFLMRAPSYHAGRYFEMVASKGNYARVLDEFPYGAVFVIEYSDVRDAAGLYHKGRVMVIDGELYPTHLAFGSEWKLHYFSSEMSRDASLREREAHFLADPPAVTGARAWAAVGAVAKTVDLEYFGIDFACAPGGEAVIFECNAAMVVADPGMQPRWAYRRPAYEAFLRAADRMLKRRLRS